MAVLSIAQARQYAAAAGFTGTSLDIIVAIAQAESGLNTDAVGRNADGSRDRGILQFNSRWHPEISDACAFSPACAFQAGYRVSARGTNFSAWTTFSAGTYKRFLAGSGNSSATGSGGGKPWYTYPVTQGYGPTHYALDFGTPMGTPFFFLESGTVMQADYAVWSGAAGGGEVFLKPDDGGPQEYAYHLDDIVVRKGQHVTAGQLAGYTGGQNVGGKHPTSPMWSSGPHLHFGLYTGYRMTPVGSRPYGPDPSPLIAQAKASGITETGDTSSGLPPGSGASGIMHWGQRLDALLKEVPGFPGIALALDDAEQFPGIVSHMGESSDIGGQIGDGIRTVLDTAISNMLPLAFRATLVLVGFILLIGLILKLAMPVAEQIAPAAQLAAMAA